MGRENLLWLNIQGISKKEILEGLGFKVSKAGILSLNGEKIKALDDPKIDVKIDDVKAIMPGSLKVITDISELEMIYPSD